MCMYVYTHTHSLKTSASHRAARLLLTQSRVGRKLSTQRMTQPPPPPLPCLPPLPPLLQLPPLPRQARQQASAALELTSRRASLQLASRMPLVLAQRLAGLLQRLRQVRRLKSAWARRGCDTCQLQQLQQLPRALTQQLQQLQQLQQRPGARVGPDVGVTRARRA